MSSIEPILYAAGTAIRAIAVQLGHVLAYPLDPTQRIYFVYLLSSLALAAWVYRRSRRDSAPAGDGGSFLAFLFPRGVWSQPSAWLDVRYFFFHQLLRLLIYGAFLVGATAFFSELAGAGASRLLGRELTVRSDIGPAAAFAVVLAVTVANDFGSYLMHRLQHRVPVLWEFHKVHHSATVLHPLSNYREHPVDNMAYALTVGVCTGSVSALAGMVLGYRPALTVLLGGSAVMLAYNLLGYNLRHSHIWLRWPGILSKVFGSPAHHQVHHSCHPDHIDRNFAFIFPLWDVLFGSFCLPADDRDLRFGLGNGEESTFRSCLGLYLLPFRNLVRRYRTVRRYAD